MYLHILLGRKLISDRKTKPGDLTLVLYVVFIFISFFLAF